MSATLPTLDDSPVPPAARLFELLWAGLSNVLGSATTATLLRRSIKALEASASSPFEGLQIKRVGLEYAYELPPAWHQHSPEPIEAFRTLVGELQGVLTGLTGEVVLRALDRIGGFAEAGIHFVQGAR